MSDLTGFDAGIAILRVTVGVTVAAHGYGKFFLGGRIPGTGRWFDSIGMRPGRLHALMAATTEVGAGLLLALGLLTPLASAGVVALMLVAAWTVHRHNGFFIVGSGWEYNFILAVMAVVPAVTGPGRLSVDHAIRSQGLLTGWPGFALAALGGVAAGTAQLVLFFRPPVQATAAP
jgi:putative oxidoreductase